MKRFLLMLLFGMLLVTAGCSDTPDETARTTVFSAERIAFPDGFGAEVSSLTAAGQTLLVTGWDQLNAVETEDGWLQDQLLLRLDDATGEMALEVLEAPDGFDKTAAITYSEDGEKFVTLTKLGDNGAYSRVVVRRVDASGTLVGEYDCGTLFGIDITRLRVDLAGNGGFCIRDAWPHGRETILVSNVGIAVLDASGERRMLIESREEIADSAFDGEKLLVIYRKSRASVKPVDLDAGVIGDALALPAEFDGARTLRLFPLAGYALGVCDDAGVWGLTESEDGALSAELLCDFTASGIVGSAVSSLAAVSPECFYAGVYDSLRSQRVLWRLTMMAPEAVAAESVLTVAEVGMSDYYGRFAMAEFGMESETYRVEVKSYADTMDATGRILSGTGESAFELDMAAGEIPDVILFSASNGDKYADIGLFADLAPRVDADASLRLLPAVRSVNERDGRLYWIPMQNMLDIRYTHEPPEGWSLDIFLDMLAEGNFQKYMNGFTMVSDYLPEFLGDFVDLDAGGADFDTPTFRRFAGMFRELANKPYVPFDEDAVYRVTSYNGLGNPAKLARIVAKDGMPTILGTPTMESGLLWGISAKSAHPDAAWELLRLRLTDDYVTATSGMYLPLVTESAAEAWLAEYENCSYYVTDNAVSVLRKPMREDELRRTNGPGVLVGADAGIIDFIRALIGTARGQSASVEAVLAIIEEELSEYAGREQPLDDVIARINSRVGIYVSERAR